MILSVYKNFYEINFDIVALTFHYVVLSSSSKTPQTFVIDNKRTGIPINT